MSKITWKLSDDKTAVEIQREGEPRSYSINLAEYAAAAEQTILISDTTGVSVSAPCFDALQQFIESQGGE